MTTQISVDDYLQKIKKILLDSGNPETAQGQMAYMKNKFDFFGLKAPIWMGIAKTFFKEHGIFDGENLKTYVRLCFDEPHREMHYIAIEMTQQALPHQTEHFIFFLEELILTKSWWDSVDWLAKLVALHFARFPHQMHPTTEGWMVSNKMWLQRVAITFQRYYKNKTDAAMLFDYVLRLAHSTEFFIQKGSGWALREYSKIDPQAVLDFVNNHDLPRLTRREAIRLMDNSLTQL
jgi:3-methyladenine DNA glycosylase AlkD